MPDHRHPGAGGAPPPPEPPPVDRPSWDASSPLELSVAAILDDVPEFAPVFDLLVEEFDDDPGPAVVLSELAEFVAGLLARGGDPAVVERTLDAVETVARLDPDGPLLVTGAFLDRLADPDRRQLSRWFGPLTRALLADLPDDEAFGLGAVE
jgi:hypothetical protein